MTKKSRGTYTIRRLFPTLPQKEITLFQENSSILRLKKGQNLFISGDSPRSIYAVANGCLKIVREGQEGESVITSISRAGHMFGLQEVFGEFKYFRTAIALKESEVFSFDKDMIINLIQRNPDVALHFMKLLSKALCRMEKRVESDVYRPAKNRVATVLYELYQSFAEEGQLTFETPLNRRDIADLADVTPETVSRAIAELKNASILEANGNTFHIIDLNSLQNEAEER